LPRLLHNIARIHVLEQDAQIHISYHNFANENFRLSMCLVNEKEKTKTFNFGRKNVLLVFLLKV
jgi:hypothetical protein